MSPGRELQLLVREWGPAAPHAIADALRKARVEGVLVRAEPVPAPAGLRAVRVVLRPKPGAADGQRVEARRAALPWPAAAALGAVGLAGDAGIAAGEWAVVRAVLDAFEAAGRAVAEHRAGIVGALVAAGAAMVWVLLGQAGACPGLHCPGCRCGR